jgi:hypothetical protein
MFGLRAKPTPHDQATLPIFVHALQSQEGFALAQNVWTNHARYILIDSVNGKELLRFVFDNPSCVVWLERDRGRQDTFEMVFMWGGEAGKDPVSEVYVITPQSTALVVGDDNRVKSLLRAILTTPSIVPVTGQGAVANQQGN